MFHSLAGVQEVANLDVSEVGLSSSSYNPSQIEHQKRQEKKIVIKIKSNRVI